MSNHIKLFIPGPTEVSKKTFEAFASPMIGHRSKDFQALYREVQSGLQKLFYTQRPVFFSTSSAWGVMEAAIRNLVQKKVLCCMNGAFSDKWFDVAIRCGKEADKLQYPWGKPIDPSDLKNRLNSNAYDAVTFIHNETSTGMMNPLFEVAAVMKEFPDVSFIVDCVSSFSVLKIPFDDLGIDVMLTGTQKALALPPGGALFAVSQKAMAKAEKTPARGYYFDFLEFQKNHDNSMTPSTPSISLFYALKSKIAEIFEEGLENRYQRHLTMALMTRQWAKERGFELFPQIGYESISLSCIKNNLGIDIPQWIQLLKNRFSMTIDGGYGKIKGQTFRISHMGDETPKTIGNLLDNLDECLQELKKA
ncbi:alanine--glyoxylate aminotransferase family protein [Candidatus Methylacidiphilum fumarolicum]|uniref:Serine-glyoxylate aminotransferase n=2 Tax=Candidatus Methylacidiphilum fumarolicum TaxID=591154 RepID=I0JZQ3_METFB|nr:alanine--glyoxylate aminotransferase family protein [Candidatus Methylacidiphilum fumarolicum]MBW6415860.1 alanine--glyoxylate aminotransferase family protein [Candidatus Methylacidiphilum fumarolicum]TFE67679.1 aminotransferase [Candidatus Methylacidiphilum fumarolicum]TFE72428.1 alanine--glyoxylate aminotransferase family protein [Candidatus Methylacidiphilum fumarolicum]TFE72446.1 alanine--glyoxylate aminotransferase family protein [Candidatus Methylacidiphilum fumarolicum]TFE77803.1 ami